MQMIGSGTTCSPGTPLTRHTRSPRSTLGAFRMALIVLPLLQLSPTPRRNIPPPPAHKSVYPPQKETKQRPSEKPPRKRSTQGKLQAAPKPPRGSPPPCAPPSLSPTCCIPTSLPFPLPRRSQGHQKRTACTTSHNGKQQRTDFHSTASQSSISSDNLKQTRLPFALSSRHPPPRLFRLSSPPLSPSQHPTVFSARNPHTPSPPPPPPD